MGCVCVCVCLNVCLGSRQVFSSWGHDEILIGRFFFCRQVLARAEPPVPSFFDGVLLSANSTSRCPICLLGPMTHVQTCRQADWTMPLSFQLSPQWPPSIQNDKKRHPNEKHTTM